APFPLTLLPTALQAAVREVARFNKVPEASPALVGIGTLATAIGKRALVVERDGLLHQPALFLVGIAGSGERKSPAFRAMTQPLEQWATLQEPEWEVAARRARARNAAVDSEIAKLKRRKEADLEETAKQIEQLEAERLAVPPAPRLFTTDCTEERVFQMMHERAGAFAVMSGEGRPVFDAILGKYSGDGRTGDAVYLAGISGDTITRDRIGSGDGGPEERVIRRPCLNVCVMVQPDKYLEVAAHPALRASGALARIWPAWLPSMVGRQHERLGEPGLNADRLAPYSALVLDVLTHVPAQDQQGRPIPHRARLSAEAAEARIALHNLLQDRMADGCDLADVRDIAAKAVSQICKLAMVLHVAADPAVLRDPASEIGAGTWTAAHCIGLWFLDEAVRVQRAAVEDPLLETARRTLQWLARRDEPMITTRTLSLYGPRPRPDAKKASAVLELLEDLGWIRAESISGRRKPQYRLHPSVRRDRKR
ncbi:MAG: DUF3987 domain-containing protein, partial [Thiohalocapsa sp.]|nr:DUF3987 domain-containing protein [Thiohalocapsa sp.]